MDFQNQFFLTFQELRGQVENWCRVNYHPICVGDSHLDMEHLTFQCPHSIKRRSQSVVNRMNVDGVDNVHRRPMQSVNFTGCSFRINLGRYRNTGMYKIGKCVLEHSGHPIGLDYYATYSIKKYLDPQREMIEQLVRSNAPSRAIAETLKENTGGNVRRKDVENFKRSILTAADISSDYSRFCDSIQSFQFGGFTGTVHHLVDNTGKVAAAFFCTAQMQFHLVQCQPKLVQMDSTFGVDKNRYKVSAVVYHNSGTNLTEVGAIFFVNKETKENYRFVLQLFRELFVPEYFLVDKDLFAIEVLLEIFPRARIFLCIWHVMCYLKKLINTAVRFGGNQRPANPGNLRDNNNGGNDNDENNDGQNDRWDDDDDEINFDLPPNMPARSPGKKALTTEEKKDIFDAFVKLVYASDQENFNEKQIVFLQKASGVWVKANTRRLADYTQLAEQYLNNWDGCQSMWALFHRSIHPVADHTTNRIERSWWSIKSYLKMRFHSKPSIEVAIEAVVKMWNERFRIVNKIKIKTIRHPDPLVCSVFEAASIHLTDTGLKLLLAQLEVCFRDRETNEIVGVTTQECPCPYHRMWQFPCCHMLWYRHISGVSIFHLDNFQRKFWKNHFLLPVEEVENVGVDDMVAEGAHNEDANVGLLANPDFDGNNQLNQVARGQDRFFNDANVDHIRAGWREMFGRLERDLEDRGVPYNNQVWRALTPLVDLLLQGHCPSEEGMRRFCETWRPQPGQASPLRPHDQLPQPASPHHRYRFYEQNPQRGRPRGRHNQRQPVRRGPGQGRPANGDIPARIRGVRRNYGRNQ